MTSTPVCTIVMYHYVRDLPRTAFPTLQGLRTDDFRRQVDWLCERYEMATLESALAFWRGEYAPSRDLCLLTFDDGLKDHYTDVLPILVDRGIQGMFFLITSCFEEGRVVPVHKNHFLMAGLGFDAYRQAFFGRLATRDGDVDIAVDMAAARRTYRWDTDEVAAFRYLLNFRLAESLRDSVIDDLFEKHCGDETEFARELYLSWDEAKEMQACRMLLGGHSHRHAPLASLSPDDQQSDLDSCANILRRWLGKSILRPFSYPHGKADTFTARTMEMLKRHGFDCAFSTIPGETHPGDDLFGLYRVDTNSVGIQ